MNPIRQLLNKWRYSGEEKPIRLQVDNHTDSPPVIDGTDIKDINPNGFTTEGSDFEIPYHRVLSIEEQAEMHPGHERDTGIHWRLIYEKKWKL